MGNGGSQVSIFTDCKLIDCEQRSEEWFKQRKGYLTASQFGDWLTKSGKVADKARLTAASRCLAEFYGCPDASPFESDDMKRGVELEPEARNLFSLKTGFAVDEIGFAKSKHGFFGCSPDGIMQSGEGLEIKCPRLSKLIQYLENDELPDDYKAQVHGSMAVTGAKVWWFAAYYPSFPMFIKKVERNQYTEDMLAGLKSYHEYYQQLAKNIMYK